MRIKIDKVAKSVQLLEFSEYDIERMVFTRGIPHYRNKFKKYRAMNHADTINS